MNLAVRALYFMSSYIYYKSDAGETKIEIKIKYYLVGSCRRRWSSTGDCGDRSSSSNANEDRCLQTCTVRVYSWIPAIKFTVMMRLAREMSQDMPSKKLTM
jgi:hypothetical protein